MAINLFEASHQWATRPSDERFENIPSMLAACKHYADISKQAIVPLNSLRLEADAGDLKLIGKANTPAQLTHYSFGQMARFASAPPSYLRELPATLAAQCINHGFKARFGEDTADKANLLIQTNGKLLVRALTTDSYDRVWNWEVLSKLGNALNGEGWVVPPARPAFKGQKGTRKATAADILPNQKDFGLAIKVGDDIAPAGLYASDHDMFAFLVNMADPVNDGVKLLNHGVFVQNSEVGDCALKFKFFTLDNVCGNHIVWGAGNITEVSVRHVKGENEHKGRTLSNGLSKWRIMSRALPSGDEMSAQIAKARKFEIAATKEDVLDAIVKFAKVKGLGKLTRGVVDAAYETTVATPRYGAPTTVWGMVNGLTENSQKTGWQDERTEIDVQAGRLMEMAF